MSDLLEIELHSIEQYILSLDGDDKNILLQIKQVNSFVPFPFDDL